MDYEGCRIGHPSQSEHDCCGYRYYNFGFGSPIDEDDFPNNDDNTDSPKDEEENGDQILKWMKETEDLRKLGDEDFKQAAYAMGENELMTKALHMLFEDLVTQEKKAVRNSLITFRRLLSQAIHIKYGEMTQKIELSRLPLVLNAC